MLQLMSVLIYSIILNWKILLEEPPAMHTYFSNKPLTRGRKILSRKMLKISYHKQLSNLSIDKGRLRNLYFRYHTTYLVCKKEFQGIKIANFS